MKQIFGLVPAGGVGARMGADRPKQYLRLGARTLLERAVASLLADARVSAVTVVVAPDDALAATLGLPERCQLLHEGGATRALTVRAGLRALAARAPADAWVLVHDAARPCLAAADLGRLIDACSDACSDARGDRGGTDEHGALLAVPLSDTVKRGADGRVTHTVDRAGLWRALTPQFFRIDVLLRALEQFAGPGVVPDGITDEASAVERLGLRPRLVAGDPGNIKVTTPGDLAVAEAYLRLQGAW